MQGALTYKRRQAYGRLHPECHQAHFRLEIEYLELELTVSKIDMDLLQS